MGPTTASLLAQTFEDFEWVVVDDASTDDTVAFVEGLDDDRIRLHRLHENRGPAATRNVGFELARGKFIAVLDHDDIWFPERLEACTALLENNPDADIVSTDMFNGDPLSETSPSSLFATPGAKERPLASVETWISGPIRFCCSGFVVKRSVIAQLGGYDERLWAVHDWELMCRIVMGGFTAKTVDEILGWTVIREGQASANSSERNSLDRMMILEEFTQSQRPEIAVAASSALVSVAREECERLLRNSIGETVSASCRRRNAVKLLRVSGRADGSWRWKLIGISLLFSQWPLSRVLGPPQAPAQAHGTL